MKAVLVRPTERSSAYLHQQDTQIRERCGRRIGQGPILSAVVTALSESKVSFADCQTGPEITVRLMRLLRNEKIGGR